MVKEIKKGGKKGGKAPKILEDFKNYHQDPKNGKSNSNRPLDGNESLVN